MYFILGENLFSSTTAIQLWLFSDTLDEISVILKMITEDK